MKIAALLSMLLTGCSSFPARWSFAFEKDGHRFEVGVDTGKRVARTQKPASK